MPDMSDLKKSCFRKCFLDTDYIMTSNAQTGLSYSNFSGVSENCYSFEDPYNSKIIKIYVDKNNDIIDITVESDWSDARFYLENNNWISNYSTSLGYSSKFYPCENKLPEGASDEDFTIPTNVFMCGEYVLYVNVKCGICSGLRWRIQSSRCRKH